jgi:hypothetical protein
MANHEFNMAPATMNIRKACARASIPPILPAPPYQIPPRETLQPAQERQKEQPQAAPQPRKDAA